MRPEAKHAGGGGQQFFQCLDQEEVPGIDHTWEEVGAEPIPWIRAHSYKSSPHGTTGHGRSTNAKLTQVPRGAVSGTDTDEASRDQASAERTRSAKGVKNVRKRGPAGQEEGQSPD